MLTVRARALLQGRLAPSVEDVLALARPVLSHRMVLSFAAGLVLLVLTALAGSATIASVGLLPMALLIAAMFFTSLWFTFRDSFSADAT